MCSGRVVIKHLLQEVDAGSPRGRRLGGRSRSASWSWHAPRRGARVLIGRVIAISMAREMGPFMTALTIAASVGSAMAAEIGTMKVSEEIDALDVMGIDPARFLVLPRLIALGIMTPVLTIYVVVVGTLGGALISSARFGVTLDGFVSDVEAFLALTLTIDADRFDR